MTDEELAAIRERSTYALIREPVDTTKFEGMVASLEDVPALLAEVAALREIVRAVAREQANIYDDDGRRVCGFCGCQMDPEYTDDPDANQHATGCEVTKARALLGDDTPR